MTRIQSEYGESNVIAPRPRLYRAEREPSPEPWAAELQVLIDDVLPQLKATTAITLLMLWRHADADGYVDSSLNRLSDDAGQGRTTTYRSLRELKRLGFLEVVERRAGWLTTFRVNLRGSPEGVTSNAG